VLIAAEAARHHHLQPQQHHQLDALVAVDTTVCRARHLGLQQQLRDSQPVEEELNYQAS
jgi:hypothetical protein